MGFGGWAVIDMRASRRRKITVLLIAGPAIHASTFLFAQDDLTLKSFNARVTTFAARLDAI